MSLAVWVSHSPLLKRSAQHEAIVTEPPGRDSGRLVMSSARFLIDAALCVTAEWVQFSSLWHQQVFHVLLSQSFMCLFATVAWLDLTFSFPGITVSPSPTLLSFEKCYSACCASSRISLFSQRAQLFLLVCLFVFFICDPTWSPPRGRSSSLVV